MLVDLVDGGRGGLGDNYKKNNYVILGIKSILNFHLNMNLKLKPHFSTIGVALNNFEVRLLHISDLSAWLSCYIQRDSLWVKVK